MTIQTPQHEGGGAGDPDKSKTNRQIPKGVWVAVTILVSIVSYAVYFLLFSDSQVAIGFRKNAQEIFIQGAFFTFALGTFLYLRNYLDDTVRAKKGQNDDKETFRTEINVQSSRGVLDRLDELRTRKAIEKLHQEISGLKDVRLTLDDSQRDGIIGVLKQQLMEATGAEFIAILKAQAADLARTDAYHQAIIGTYQDARERLYREIEALGKRGNLSLALGVVTTVMGLLILGWFLLLNQEPPQEPWPFLVHYLPRLTLVLFIELFAYFFLRLYKAGLEEIKYFQNELTNLETKHIALLTAFKQNDPATINAVITTLAATERNRILNKDQTTIELETARIDKQSTADLTKQLADLVSALAPKKKSD